MGDNPPKSMVWRKLRLHWACIRRRTRQIAFDPFIMAGQYQQSFLGALIMKTRFIYYTMLLMVVVSRAANGETIADEWGTVSNEVQMSISLKGGNRILKTNESFQLLVRVKNLYGTNVWSFLNALPTTDGGGGLDCEIISPSGRDISPDVTYFSVSGGA
jgi:hypothetical protein